MNESKEINGHQIDAVFKQIGYIFGCASLMVGGAAVAKYAEKISPSFPEVCFASGILLALVGIGLSVWVGFYGMQEIARYFNSRIKGFLYGSMYLVFALQVAIGSFHAATNSIDNGGTQNQKHETNKLSSN